MLQAYAQTDTAAQTIQNTQDISGMMDYFLLALFVGCGLYVIFSCFAQHRSQSLRDNKLMVPSNQSAAGCKKPKEHIAFILPKAFTLGVGLVLSGALLAVDHLTGSGGAALTLLLMVLPLALMGWYVRQLHKAEKLYW